MPSRSPARSKSSTRSRPWPSDAIEALGPVDILVNNAGVASRGNTVADTDPDGSVRLVRTHAIGPHWLSAAVLPEMRTRPRGDIVFISSAATRRYAANGAPYNMGKSAMEALAFTLAKEERANGIHVNIVAPGLVRTEMGRRLVRAWGQDIEAMDPAMPFGRVCRPEDVADVVRWLVSDGAGYVNGERIYVDARRSVIGPVAWVAWTTMSDTITEPIITVTDQALAKILELRGAEDDPDGLGLRVEVTGVRGADFTYDLSFEPLDERAEDDVVHEQNGLPVVVPAGSVDNLLGATLDLPSNADQGGLVLRNPNRPQIPSLGDPIELSGTTEEKVRQLLDQQVNPAIAAHGGYASVVKVEGETAFITMGGGCQGCAMSAMTLREGIESAILGAIPEITEVVDTTDHSVGENPYY